jgi:hypothetical protein
MNSVQIDTGDLVLALQGLVRPEGEVSSSEETGAAVELCNNLIMYAQVVYDGNVHEPRRSEIESLIVHISESIEDSDTKSLFQNKLQPLRFDKATEPLIIQKSAIEAASFLSVIDQLLAAPAASGIPHHKDDPFTDPQSFLKFLTLSKPPEGSQIEYLLSDRSIKGGRFFWGLLQKETFNGIGKYLQERSGHEVERLGIIFTRYRYRLAVNRGKNYSEASSGLIGKVYYHPGLGRQVFMSQFERCLDEVSTWKKEIERELMQQCYPDDALYVDRSRDGLYLSSRTNIPLLVNRALRSLSKSDQLSRVNLVRQCLEQSQDPKIEEIWNALYTYDGLSEKEKKECLEQIRDYMKTHSDPLVSGKQVLEAAGKFNLLEMLKDLSLKAIVDNLSSQKYAASILGRSVDGLLKNPEALDDIGRIFGSIPN